jgi:anti-sigma-K factor RskA
MIISKTQVEPLGAIATAKMQLPESYAGFLQDNQGATRVLVSSLRHGKVVDIKWLRPLELGTEQTLQLWALAKDAPPIALGSIPAQGKGNITMKDTSEVLLSKVTELAISVELKSGAPVSAPSGSFVLRGPCAKFW